MEAGRRKLGLYRKRASTDPSCGPAGPGSGYGFKGPQGHYHRSVKGIGVTYATSPMGGDHTAGYAVTANIMKVGGDIHPLRTESQAKLSSDLQVATAFIDSAGLCLFVAFPMLDIPDVFNAVGDREGDFKRPKSKPFPASNA